MHGSLAKLSGSLQSLLARVDGEECYRKPTSTLQFYNNRLAMFTISFPQLRSSCLFVLARDAAFFAAGLNYC